MEDRKFLNLPHRVTLSPAARNKLSEERAKLPPTSPRKPIDFGVLDRAKVAPSSTGNEVKRKALLDMLSKLRSE